VKPSTRLPAANYDVVIADHPVCISVAYDHTGAPVEIVIHARGHSGKSDTGLQLVFAETGIALSRILQGRDPEA